MVLGDFDVARSSIAENGDGTYRLFLKNVQINNTFYDDVIKYHPNGIPICAGDCAQLSIMNDAGTITREFIMITKVIEYVVPNDSTTIDTLTFSYIPIRTTADSGHNIPEVEPFPVNKIYCRGDFIAIELSGDIERLVCDRELYQTHVVKKYSTFNYLGKTYYMCDFTKVSPKINEKAGGAYRLCEFDHHDGLGMISVRVGLIIVASTRSPSSKQGYDRFIHECQCAFTDRKGV